MAERTLKIKFDGDSTGLAQASEQSSATLERFNKTTEDTKRGMDRVGEGSENLADSSSLATGALGALASGFELVGLEGYAEKLQQASLATDFMSGVGDSLTLVTQKLGLAKLKDTLATVRQTAATKVQTVVTKGATVAQRGLNLVLRANPIGLVITALAGLVAIFVIAYKKSETFRRIVDAAFGGIKRAAETAWRWIRDAWGVLPGWIADKFGALVDGVRKLPAKVRSAASGMWDGIKDSFKGALNAIIRWWNDFSLSVNIPDAIPGLPDSFTINTPNIGYLAAGGYAARGRTYLVGENGPELLTMGGRGFVTPNNRLPGAGLSDSDLRTLAGRLLELIGRLMEAQVSAGNRHTKRRALAGVGGSL